jgi:hypothetical protein
MLSIDDVVKDFDAICDRVDRDGSPRPPFVSTVQRTSSISAGTKRSSWCGAPSPTRSSLSMSHKCSGASYINPSETHDARVWMWVRSSAWDEGLDPLLEAAVREWLGREELPGTGSHVDWEWWRPGFVCVYTDRSGNVVGRRRS